MMLILTRSDSRIKIRVFGAIESQPLVKLDKNLRVARL